ncbi:toprim domain-containing protein [Rhizobium sp. BG4]|uniref:DUF7146 domain-containing protein n=1 Tax=Rhizobium sp. BG4 TaxID=2613770 RepID=UPI00193D4DDB|nr:toprim domain-containing protein [Rhizobium sp. BG4]QRM47167.1 DNA primase [Rhizobium sp. BG4]
MLSPGELAERLAQDAEAVCRHYLSAGRRAGHYWLVGDVDNTRGASLYVHLAGPRAGRWTDAATGQFGDLLDLIRETCGLIDFRDVAFEARRFLSLPRPEPLSPSRSGSQDPAVVAPPASERARRLFRTTQPLAGTLADAYLRGRGILRGPDHAVLRFHAACYYRDLVTGQTSSYPALIAAVTGPGGEITGIHRCFLDPAGGGKARVDNPRRALGALLGNGVRFCFPLDAPIPVVAAGEGLETVLSLSQVMPGMPLVAALSASHLAAFRFPPGCQRIYIAADADAAGRHAVERLSRRAQICGILPLVLSPELSDFNEDLRWLGPDRMAASLMSQLTPEDAMTFMA